MRIALALIPVLALTACATYTPMNYPVSDANVAAMKSAGAVNVNVGPFTGPAGFDNACRAAGPIGLPGGVGFAEYIRGALTDELKAAGALNDKNPAVTLTVSWSNLNFRRPAVSGISG